MRGESACDVDEGVAGSSGVGRDDSGICFGLGRMRSAPRIKRPAEVFSAQAQKTFRAPLEWGIFKEKTQESTIHRIK